MDFLSPIVFRNVQEIATRHSLDLSDAFQILSVKEGFFSGLVHESETILVTADQELSKAAKREGIRVWYFMKEPIPN